MSFRLDTGGVHTSLVIGGGRMATETYGFHPTETVRPWNTGLYGGAVEREEDNQEYGMTFTYALDKNSYMDLRANIIHSMGQPPLYQAYGMNGGVNCTTWAMIMLYSIGVQGPYRPK